MDLYVNTAKPGLNKPVEPISESMGEFFQSLAIKIVKIFKEKGEFLRKTSVYLQACKNLHLEQNEMKRDKVRYVGENFKNKNRK